MRLSLARDCLEHKEYTCARDDVWPGQVIHQEFFVALGIRFRSPLVTHRRRFFVTEIADADHVAGDVNTSHDAKVLEHLVGKDDVATQNHVESEERKFRFMFVVYPVFFQLFDVYGIAVVLKAAFIAVFGVVLDGRR